MDMFAWRLTAARENGLSKAADSTEWTQQRSRFNIMQSASEWTRQNALSKRGDSAEWTQQRSGLINRTDSAIVESSALGSERRTYRRYGHGG
jgi:hypothetical protein